MPIPSEVILPPAAFWAAQGSMNFWGVVAAGGAGSYFGSAISYWVARWAGSKLIPRYGRYVGLSERNMVWATSVVQHFGAMGVFVARLLPVIRHLISLPAGLFKMNFALFSFVTATGATLWCWVLALWGERVLGAHPELLESPEEMVRVIRAELFWFVAAVAAFFALYIGVRYYREKSTSRQGQ